MRTQKQRNVQGASDKVYRAKRQNVTANKQHYETENKDKQTGTHRDVNWGHKHRKVNMN